MAEEQQTALQRWGSSRTPSWFWVVLVLVLVPLIVAGVVCFAQLGQSTQERRVELDARSVERIDIEPISDGAGGYRDLIRIGGESRYDCSEDAGVPCSDDPEPTEQQVAVAGRRDGRGSSGVANGLGLGGHGASPQVSDLFHEAGLSCGAITTRDALGVACGVASAARLAVRGVDGRHQLRRPADRAGTVDQGPWGPASAVRSRS